MTNNEKFSAGTPRATHYAPLPKGLINFFAYSHKPAKRIPMKISSAYRFTFKKSNTFSYKRNSLEDSFSSRGTRELRNSRVYKIT